MATDDELDELACVFATFAEETYHGSSPLYYALAKGVSEDRDLLGIASSAHMSPVPNFLFGAVHYLLLGGTTSRLRKKGVSVKLPCRWSQKHDDVRP